MRVVLLNEESEIAEYLQEADRDWFTTVVTRGSVEGRIGIVLLSFGSDLEMIGRIEKSRAVATLKDVVRCSNLVPIKPPVSLDDLKANMPANVRRHVSYRMLPPSTGDEALGALTSLRPELADVIERLRDDPADAQHQSPTTRTVAMEKDAVGLALEIFGADRAVLTEWTPGDRSRPFLAGLRQAVLREDQVIAHDAGVFGDWKVVRRSAIGSVQFTRSGRLLTVINVNRLALENTIGVDLVYYNEQYEAFVLVQYKRLMREGGGGWLYRPDGNHASEVERMESIPEVAADPGDELSYRLNPGACYFKLCESTVFDPFRTELLPGMYLPLDYLRATESVARGTRGGLAYGYDTVPRHLNNTQFVHLVQDAWVGSAGPVSVELREFVEARVQDGDSMMLAFATQAPARGVRR